MVYWYRTPKDAPEWGAYSNRIDWCKKYCKGTWKYKLDGVFHFYSEEDYSLFLLAWTGR